MFNMLRRVASLAPTLSPSLRICTSLMISIVPLEIFVGIDRAWKNDVFSGPRPVFWAGMMTGQGAMAPLRAGARTLFSSSLSRTSTRSPRVNTNPTLPRTWGSNFSNAGLRSRWPRMAFRIIVFFPISTTATPLRLIRICCICLEPTLSAPTMKHFG